MSLACCKECGERISKKAVSCPKCGAVTPKRTSLFTWLVLAVLAYVVFWPSPGVNPYDFMARPLTEDEKTVKAALNGASKDLLSTKPKKKVVAPPVWSSFDVTDAMTGKTRSYARSPLAHPLRKMGFPYNSVSARLYVLCNKKREQAYISFTSINLNSASTKTKKGYDIAEINIKWDDTLSRESMSKEWGSDVMYFRFSAGPIAKIVTHDKVRIELSWYKEGQVYFDFSLKGSAAALTKIRERCEQS